jgi:hypothetical protein
VQDRAITITQKRKKLADDIVFLARSLGFRVSINNTIGRCQNGFSGTYYKVRISGDIWRIPCLVKHKRDRCIAAQREYKIYRNILNTGIKLTPLGEGDYYGFIINGNHRYLLKDFTVTHNTSYVQLLSRIYSKDGKFIASNMGTAKGLVPSYGAGEPSPGMLISPVNFLKVVDEFFRRAHKEALSKGMRDPSAHVYNFVSEAMNVVERRPDALAGSGKGSLPPGTFMKDSFLATDNLQEDILSSLCEMIRTDKAVARRFTFLKVTDQDADNVKNAQERPSPDEMYKRVNTIFMKNKGFLLKDLQRFAKWFRKAAVKVRVDSKRCKATTEAIEIEFIKGVLTTGQTVLADPSIDNLARKWSMELNIIPFFEGFVRCCATLRCVMHEKNEVLPTVMVEDQDYIEAEKYFRRLFGDTFNIYSDGIKTAFDIESSGIKRTLHGLGDRK